jgi:chitin biosynthesis protein CHS5
MEMLSTKISGLAVDTEYSFHLVLRTSGGTYSSNTLTVRTQKMTDLTGITVTPGVLPVQLREALETAVERIGAKIVDTVRIDTTHFVCTEGRGHEWERALEMNIPVVRPEWIEGCEREGKIVGVRGYYLDANPKHRQVGSNPQITASPAPTVESQTSLPSRSVPSGPKSPGTESMGDGPGPEVPPTPTETETEKELPPPPKEEDEEEEDEEEEEEQPPHAHAAGLGAQTSNATVEEDEDEDDDTLEKGEKMEDVAL